jgi:two-component system chemotaxis response regulator CheB
MEATSAELSLPRDLVVIGASAGGVEALKQIVAGFAPDLAAAVLVVLHLAPDSYSALASILTRAGALPCRSAEDGDRLRPGEILVAPPDHHLLVDDGHVRLSVGPRENGHRPSVDVLFRSAAEARGERVVGVVLSGTRDDGTAGLARIKAFGGVAVVQDPSDAICPGMPASAISQVVVDAVVPAGQIAETVTAIVNGGTRASGAGGPDPLVPPDPLGPDDPPDAVDPDDPSNPLDEHVPPDRPPGVRLAPVCPDCGGVLTERHDTGVTQWECHVGHRYSPRSLAEAQGRQVELALWTAIRTLRERAALLLRLARQCEAGGQSRSADQFRRKAQAAAAEADVVLEALNRTSAGSLAVAETEGEIAANAAGRGR